jgi:hypothetical protein
MADPCRGKSNEDGGPAVTSSSVFRARSRRAARGADRLTLGAGGFVLLEARLPELFAGRLARLAGRLLAPFARDLRVLGAARFPDGRFFTAWRDLAVPRFLPAA